jgi:carbonic anhydrase/acetyltransferase-like protein (isoleucine patch superfamily)
MSGFVTPDGGASGGAGMRRVGRAWVADNASVSGRVTLGEDANLWYGVVVRGDDAPIRIGARTNVQDNTVIHVDPGCENVIGDDVTIGHGALVHGVRIGDHALIGMGAILLGGSVVGEGALVGAGTLVPENAEIPPWHLAVGVPARVVRPLDEAARRAEAIGMAEGYVLRAKEHAGTRWKGQLEA